MVGQDETAYRYAVVVANPLSITFKPSIVVIVIMGRSTDSTPHPFQARKRAVIKTLGYRLLMIAITIVVAWAVIGDVRAAIDIGLVANVVKTGTYYGYERLWDRISWGVST